MLNVTHKYKGLNIYFATIKPDNSDGHFIYLSGYGQDAVSLLDKFIEDQRDDNGELFEQWDKIIEKAKMETGFKETEELEDGYVYISTFQNGVGISEEDEAGMKRYTSRGKKHKKISIPDLSDGLDINIDQDEDFDLNEEIEEADISDDDE